MSKTPPKGKAARQVRGGGAGRNPGDREGLRPFLFRGLFPGSKEPDNMPGGGYKSKRPPGRGKGLSRDTKNPTAEG